MKIKEIAFTAYAVNDIAKSREFYEGVLGLVPNNEFDGSKNPDYVEYNIGSGTLAIGHAPDMWKPSEDGASVALEVEDFDAAMALIKEKNVPIKMGPHDFPTCQMIVIQDPDKNKLTLHKRKK
ncbi:MAG TPA: VOC family protein [Candidatus Paceibacterota bacterium]|nr:VOC family protein [Candidatus Paceibacterota bacterium]